MNDPAKTILPLTELPVIRYARSPHVVHVLDRIRFALKADDDFPRISAVLSASLKRRRFSASNYPRPPLGNTGAVSDALKEGRPTPRGSNPHLTGVAKRLIPGDTQFQSCASKYAPESAQELVTALNLHGMAKAICAFSDFWFEVRAEDQVKK